LLVILQRETERKSFMMNLTQVMQWDKFDLIIEGRSLALWRERRRSWRKGEGGGGEGGQNVGVRGVGRWGEGKGRQMKEREEEKGEEEELQGEEEEEERRKRTMTIMDQKIH
jgi:hypothetical protein